jgi:AcrR family transcriptional regulator
MTDNDNSVNIKGDIRAYHHGDLKGAAIAEGLRLLEIMPLADLSLREIARNVGVSATALYRHFPDKDALLTALARDGLRELARLQKPQKGLSIGDGFVASGRAYVRFALAHPALFKLIFSSLPSQAHPSDTSVPGSPAWLLYQNVTHLLGEKTTAVERYVAVLRAWSLVHGLSMLILDQQVDRIEAEQLIDQVISVESLRLG